MTVLSNHRENWVSEFIQVRYLYIIFASISNNSISIVQLIIIFQMNFSLINPTDAEYNKVMMQKHLDQKRHRKENVTQSSVSPPSMSFQNKKRISDYQSISKAGHNLLTQSYANISNYNFRTARKKQLNQQNEKMKKLLKEQLENSLKQQNNKKKLQNEEEFRIRKAMAEQNGMLDYLQRQIYKRDDFIKKCLINQEVRKNKFIDEDQRKHRKALQHIEQNYDADVFNHQSDRYQQKQKIDFKIMLLTNNFQAENKKVEKQIERNQYGKYLDDSYKKQKHNPITNPMQYHIENPYIRKRLQNF